MKNTLLPNLIIGVLGATSVIVMGSAAYKIVQSLPYFKEASAKIVYIKTADSSKPAFNNSTTSTENSAIQSPSVSQNTQSNSPESIDSNLSAQSNQNNIENQTSSYSSTNINSSTKSFTIDQLATYNQNGNCYIAYQNLIYDVSNNSSWIGCRHHGINGGRDITSIFPHSTSYFSTLTVIGNLISNTNTT